jgi:radial spoke head protein 9
MAAHIEEGEPYTLKEEKRLAAVMGLINYQVEIVPRGAYYRDANQKFSFNPSFKGLYN